MTWKNCWERYDQNFPNSHQRSESATRNSNRNQQSGFTSPTNNSKSQSLQSSFKPLLGFTRPTPRRPRDRVKEKNITGGIRASNHPLLQFKSNTCPERELLNKLNAPERKLNIRN